MIYIKNAILPKKTVVPTRINQLDHKAVKMKCRKGKQFQGNLTDVKAAMWSSHIWK